MAGPVAGVAALIIGAGIWAMFLRPSSAASGAATYRAVAASIGTIRQAVAATGTIGAADTAELSFPSAGKVTAVKVTAGQKVAKGQTLASIDSATLKSAVAAAQASLSSAGPGWTPTRPRGRPASRSPPTRRTSRSPRPS